MWVLTPAINLTFSPRRRNRDGAFLFFGSACGQFRRGFLKKSGNVKSFPPGGGKQVRASVKNNFCPVQKNLCAFVFTTILFFW
jgi:hypothetical protein